MDKENAPVRSLGGRKMESSTLSSQKLGLKTQRSALLDKCMNKRKRASQVCGFLHMAFKTYLYNL